MTKKLDRLKERYEAERIGLAIERTARQRKILAKWDVLENNRLRKQPARETSDEGGIYTQTKRLLGCNLGRDLERNYSPAKGMLHQFRVNVVGSLGKLQVNTDGGEDATDWFNEVWSKDCDFRDDLDWSTLLQNILAGVHRDGDVLAVVDDDLVEDTGKILTWEADQVVPFESKVFEATSDWGKKDANGKPMFVQDSGIIRDTWGRIAAFISTGLRGHAVISKFEDASVWKREQARLIRHPWRLNQGRGTPAILTASSNFVDLYEILASELQSAKRTAKQYAYVHRDNAVTNFDSPTAGTEFLPENDGRTSTDVAADGANQTTHTARNYEKLETFTGGLTDYLDPQDKVEFPKLDHPNSSLAQFIEAVHGYSGSALGLARAYTILRADSSYTAFRGDMIMTWVTFYWLQKWLERQVADWVARRVLGWAQRKKQVAPLPAGWERSLSWTWPKMPEVDELDAENAVAAALKNGTTDYSQLLGPDWRKRLQGLADQVQFIREILLPLGILEGKSGGQVDNPKKAESETKQKGTEK